ISLAVSAGITLVRMQGMPSSFSLQPAIWKKMGLPDLLDYHEHKIGARCGQGNRDYPCRDNLPDNRPLNCRTSLCCTNSHNTSTYCMGAGYRNTKEGDK